MENIELLEDKKTQNNQGEISSDIFDNISKNIDVQKLIDDGILQISDDVKKYIDGIGYEIIDVLKLAGMYEEFSDMKVIYIDHRRDGIFVSISGKFYSFSDILYPIDGFIDFEKSNTSLSDNISAFKILYNQISIAKNKGYKSIVCSAGRESTLNGYVYRPMIGFRSDPDINISDLVIKSDNIQINDCKTLNGLFDLRDENGNYIGIEFWKENGFGFNAKFDLTINSKSLKRLNEYILSKKQSNPDKYNDIDVIA